MSTPGNSEAETITTIIIPTSTGARIMLNCLRCRRLVRARLVSLTDRVMGETTMVEIALAYECPACNGRNGQAHLTIEGNGQKPTEDNNEHTHL